MKAIVAVLVGMVVLAAGFGVYRWLSDDDERARAEAAAEQWMSYCKRAGSRCDVVRVEPISAGFWRLHVRNPGSSATRCFALDLDRFQAVPRGGMYVQGTVEGISDTACGPEWWTGRDAARRLEGSAWARERKAEFITCTGRGENRWATHAREFGCRYSTPTGDGFVFLTTTGPDTFKIESGD